MQTVCITNQYRTITRADRDRHITFGFEVPSGLHVLYVHTSYTPKFGTDTDYMRQQVQACYVRAYGQEQSLERVEKCLPLGNHIAWSIDSPLGPLGTEHRANPDQEHTITPIWASSGFSPSPIHAGHWTITASINSVVTETVDICIRVEAR